MQGREYTLCTQEDPEQIQRVVSFVEARFAKVVEGGSVDTRDMTMLTLLNLAGEYLQLLDEQRCWQVENERLERLAEQVESLINNNSGC
jgi:cell division protein ZapA